MVMKHERSATTQDGKKIEMMSYVIEEGETYTKRYVVYVDGLEYRNCEHFHTAYYCVDFLTQ